MPLYEYEPVSESCPECQGGFEVLQALDDPPLTACPACGQPCRRVVSVPGALRRPCNPLSPSNLKEKGFTRYVKDSPGVYRKTAGVGPDTIKR